MSLDMNKIIRPCSALAVAAALSGLAAGPVQASAPVEPSASTASDAAKAPAAGGAKPAAAPAKASGPVEALEARLEEALRTLDADVRSAPDLYAAAKARLGEAKALLKDDPEAPETRDAFQACSLLTEAAIAQVRAQSLSAERARLLEQRTRVLTDLALVHDELNKLERGNSSRLKADLDEAKRKAAEARAEAEKKFSELNSALIQVSKDARGTIISMSDILFDVGKATLTGDLKTSLAKIAGILTIYKDANVLVEGHTDNVGGEEYNQKLSEKRAQNVMDFLVNPGGIAAARLSAQGHGFSKPIADNSTKEGRQKNRRVDLVVMDKKPQ
jgi:outer membrane protein OmpA-like peptidoglycan-associated protein